MNLALEVQQLCVRREKVRGIPIYVRELVSQYIKEDKDIFYTFFDYKKERNNRRNILENLGLEENDNIRLLECNTVNYKWLFDAAESDNGFYNTIDNYSKWFSKSFDLVHIPTATCIPRNIDSRLVVTAHDVLALNDEIRGWTVPERKRFISEYEYLSQNKDITIITDSDYTKSELINRLNISEERVYTIPLAYDKDSIFFEEDEQVLQALGIKDEYILYLGALDSRKGITSLVEAFDRITCDNNLQLVIAGNLEPSYEREFIECMRRSKKRDKIVLTGYVSTKQKRVLLSMAKIFIFPSQAEGFGLPILEAMACGTPVITCDNTSLVEVGSDCVLYFEFGKVNDLAELIMMLLNEGELQLEMQKKGIKRADSFSWERTAYQTRQVYSLALL